ncbi:MAG TPA: DegT/DnrJ/EryC1/StrS family aminotransferase [Candidatus Paceibacterota bacterium]|nr:DegT/DnrJ/EryC1/StrS family aminotransferase [Candidatus Paceibacterota bacterium]
MNVPVFNATRQYATLHEEMMAAAARVFESGKFVLGNETLHFEESFAKYIGTAHGIAVNSGTDALKIALAALGVGPGHEVITVTNTAVPTVSAIRERGAIPVFVDSDDYFGMDPNKLEGKITSNTKAIVAVHLYGQPVDIEAVMTVATRHEIPVVEDCAQTTGATYKGKTAGTFGAISCFSFYPTKNLGAYGDGGMILTSSEALAATCRKLRMYGMAKTYFADIEGYNSRMDEVQAAVLSVKLPHLDTWNGRRREIATRYLTEIQNPLITLPKLRPDSTHVFHLFVIRTKHRDALQKHLTEAGVGFGTHYAFPIHLQKAYEFLGYKAGDLPESEHAAQEVLSLPLFPELTDEEVMYVIAALNRFAA